MGKSKDCYQTVRHFKLPKEHCPACHDIADVTLPVTIKDKEYNICCFVARNLVKAGIIPESTAKAWPYAMRGQVK